MGYDQVEQGKTIMSVMQYTFRMAKNRTVHTLIHAQIVHLSWSVTARALGMRWHVIGY